MSQSPSRPLFRMAISMSGAISAGAYTAGVFDFLIQALWELDCARSRGDADVPAHDVALVALAGASAGGITAALGSVALGWARAAPLAVHRMQTQSGHAQSCVLPQLWEAWVVRPRMVGGGPSESCLLSTEDLAQDRLVSVLNSAVLDDINRAAFTAPERMAAAAPLAGVADPLHVYLTASNLDGIPYRLSETGPGEEDASGEASGMAGGYGMVNHADRLHFRITGLGANRAAASDWAEGDAGTALSVDDLIATSGASPAWRKLGEAALATSAFPIGLSARILSVARSDYTRRRFPAPLVEGAGLLPWFANPAASDDAFVSVDGGMINNDPFEYARYALLEDWRNPLACNPRDPAEADRAVIMISPFPENPPAAGLPDQDIGLVRVLLALLPTLMQQVRFKPDELAAAASPGVASRMLIAPRRGIDPAEAPSSANIACGALGGFGGFLDQRFREHDFQLGRLNCQQFLQGWTQSRMTSAAKAAILPLFGSAAGPITMPPWPVMAQGDFDVLISRIGTRADAVIACIVRQYVARAPLRWLLRLGWRVLGRRWVLARLRRAMLADLTARRQIAPAER